MNLNMNFIINFVIAILILIVIYILIDKFAETGNSNYINLIVIIFLENFITILIGPIFAVISSLFLFDKIILLWQPQSIRKGVSKQEVDAEIAYKTKEEKRNSIIDTVKFVAIILILALIIHVISGPFPNLGGKLREIKGNFMVPNLLASSIAIIFSISVYKYKEYADKKNMRN